MNWYEHSRHFTVNEYVSERVDYRFEREIPDGFFDGHYEYVRMFGIPCAYHAQVFYDGVHVLSYDIDTPEFVEYLDENFGSLYDIHYEDDEYFEWLWEYSNLSDTLRETFLYHAMSGDKISWIGDVDGMDDEFVDKVLEHDGTDRIRVHRPQEA